MIINLQENSERQSSSHLDNADPVEIYENSLPLTLSEKVRSADSESSSNTEDNPNPKYHSIASKTGASTLNDCPIIVEALKSKENNKAMEDLSSNSSICKSCSSSGNLADVEDNLEGSSILSEDSNTLLEESNLFFMDNNYTQVVNDSNKTSLNSNGEKKSRQPVKRAIKDPASVSEVNDNKISGIPLTKSTQYQISTNLGAENRDEGNFSSTSTADHESLASSAASCQVQSSPNTSRFIQEQKSPSPSPGDQDNNTAISSSSSKSMKTRSSVARNKTRRCGVCKKSLDLTAITCRCGGLFCAKHRYDKEHGCTFDYKAMGADQIRKENPQIIAEKVSKL